MKKFLLIAITLCAFSLIASAQFQVTVKLTGTCIYPDQDTYYAVRIKVKNTDNNSIIETQSATVLTTTAGNPVYITVQFSSFCTADNTKKYKIEADAAKVYLNPITEICYDKKTIIELYSCDDFVFNSPIYIGELELE